MRRAVFFCLFLLPLFAITACGGDDRPAGRDAATPLDGGSGDGGATTDSGMDAGPRDAGPGDAGPGDAGPGDAGPGDAGADAGADAGTGDAGTDAATADAGPEDAGPRDTGPAIDAAGAPPGTCNFGACTPTCLRPVDCVTVCGGPATSCGCCACGAGSFDDISCP